VTQTKSPGATCQIGICAQQQSMQTAMLVFLGGGLGSMARWLMGLGVLRLLGGNFPLGTLVINLSGCFVMGLLARVIAPPDVGGQEMSGGQAMRFLLMTGFLGGYTTFSAFALDVAQLWIRGATGASLIYVGASVIGSLIAVALGLWLGGMIAARL
jgi:fluoride exporter